MQPGRSYYLLLTTYLPPTHYLPRATHYRLNYLLLACGDGISQKKATYCGFSSHCAISWCKGIGSAGGASFAVNTPAATCVEAALHPL